MGKHSKNNIISLYEARHANETVIDFEEAKNKIVVGKHSRVEDIEHAPKNGQDNECFSNHGDFFYKTIMSSIVVVLVLILAFFGVRLYDTYVVEDIQVQGNDSFEYFEIIKYSGIEYRQSMLSVNEEETIEKIESEKPMIEVKSIEKTLPNTVVIVVNERKPTCYLVLKGSQKCAVIGEGNVCLDIVDSYLEEDLPMIVGIDMDKCEKGEEIVEADRRKLKALDTISASMMKFGCVDRFEYINLSNTTNIILKTHDDNTIKIGDVKNIDNKLKSIVALLDHLQNTNQAGKSIVVTGDNAIYTEQ